MRARIRVFAAPRALLRRLYRVRLTVHHRRLTRAQLRHRCRVHYFVLSFIRLRVAEQNTTGRGSARVVIYYSGGYARQRRTGEPRGCGEYVYHRDWCLIPSGSSPRGRGKPSVRRSRRRSNGLIPARAGKAIGRREGRTMRPAHPRAGGENTGVLLKTFYFQGSSPRGRGKPYAATSWWAGERLIPARAGKTATRRAGCRSAPAHPRAGGENWRPRATLPSSPGSSPRGRGKRNPDAPRRGT